MVDKSKQLYGWWLGCVDVDISCFCGKRIQLPSDIEDTGQRVICANCGQEWSAKLEVEPIGFEEQAHG